MTFEDDVIVVDSKAIPVEILLIKIEKYEGITLEYQDKWIAQAENLVRLLRKVGVEVKNKGNKKKKIQKKDNDGKVLNYELKVNFYKLERCPFLQKWF